MIAQSNKTCLKHVSRLLPQRMKMEMRMEKGKIIPNVIYFDQRLGAAHSKCWLKYAFLAFFMPKSLKKGEKHEN